MNKQLFAMALRIVDPWYARGVEFDAASRRLTIAVDFTVGSRFALADQPGRSVEYRTCCM